VDASIEAEWLHTGNPGSGVLVNEARDGSEGEVWSVGPDCGAVIAMIIGFAWGGWTTSGTTQTMTKEAVLASQAAICVAQFVKQPNPEAKLKELEAVSTWQRAEVIEKGGWDRMPGQEKAGYAVARACADGLALLFKK
jgi:hypothetical protein